MRISIAYDGLESADAAVDDLRRAGLPPDVKTLFDRRGYDATCFNQL